MHFLPDVWVPCEECDAKRYNEDVLEVKLHGRSIADVLEMPCGEAVEVFADRPRIQRVVQTLCDVGLDYITLGQSAPTLSGGEAQRVKLAAELARPATGHTLYLLDEPTTGLHFGDIEKLLLVMQRLVEIGNSVVVIEHNLDVIKCADWVIDMGPGAGVHGGHVVFEGTPEQLARTAEGKLDSPGQRGDVMSVTAPFLAESLGRPSIAKPKTSRREEASVPSPTLPVSSEPPVSLETPVSLENSVSLEPHVVALEPEPATDVVLQPWRALGRRWHTLPKGFPENQTPRWPLDLVERTLKLLSKIAGEHSLEFNAPDRVFIKLEVQEESHDSVPKWAEVETKQADCVRLKLTGPKAAIDIDQLLSLDILRDQSDTGTVDLSHADRVTVTLNLKEIDDARSERLQHFLQTHLDRTRSLT
jgi:excinuclease ABC subunit A